MFFLLGKVRHSCACPKCYEIRNYKYLWQSSSHCIDFLHLVRNLWKLQFDHVILLGVIRYVWACPKYLEINICQYQWEGLSYSINLLHVVKHSSKLQFDHDIFFRFGQACMGLPNVPRRNKLVISLEKFELLYYFLDMLMHSWKL